MTKLVVKSSFIDRATGEYIVQGNGFAPKSDEQRDRLQKRGVLSTDAYKDAPKSSTVEAKSGVPTAPKVAPK